MAKKSFSEEMWREMQRELAEAMAEFTKGGGKLYTGLPQKKDDREVAEQKAA